jgi:hypothetical protein
MNVRQTLDTVAHFIASSYRSLRGGEERREHTFCVENNHTLFRIHCRTVHGQLHGEYMIYDETHGGQLLLKMLYHHGRLMEEKVRGREGQRIREPTIIM